MTDFAEAIIAWQKQHGRHDLPWQTQLNQTADPYAIWVSEIMLQQTQVAAVIGYYSKFMMRFPNISVLATATQEAVLQHWSGLGYYSRARNLHAAAQIIMDDFGGFFPTKFDDILSLPGIGRSTAAAISTFALSTPQPIMDGNVKRVFARHFNINGYTGTPKIAQQLWQIAERENPQGTNKVKAAITYTQGLMDLGATLCTRSKPKCHYCPVSASCEAFAKNLTSQLPTPKPRKVLPEKNVVMLVMMSGNDVLLEKRPPKGIWGGLWSLPEQQDLSLFEGPFLSAPAQLKPFTHIFTHFKLHITPYFVETNDYKSNGMQSWLNLDDAIGAAIPTPVRKILLELKSLTYNKK
jgi:A/G-specific adenine glycosylase